MIDIPVEKLVPHPQNPRKNLGDLTELAASIKKSGVFQNLTVVKNEDGETYTIIIGHRRCSAAKIAGLETLPCAVVEMDKDEQLATMLVENMNRSDLTVYEQAEGIQLLIDSGFKVDTIAEKTGFSESTIRRRTKLLELDKAKFKESQARNVSLADYEKLNQLKSVERKNKALEVLGTNNFNNVIKTLTEEEEVEEVKNAIVEKLNTFAKPIEQEEFDDAHYNYELVMGSLWLNYYNIDIMRKKLEETEIPTADELNKFDFVYKLSDSYLTLYSVVEREETAETAETAEDNSRNIYFDTATALNKKIKDLRTEFVKSYIDRKQDKELIIKKFVECTVNGFSYFLSDYLMKLTDLKKFDEKICNFDEVYNEKPLQLMLAAISNKYENYEKEYISQCNYEKRRIVSTELNVWYYFLTQIGYEMSDEEIALRDGTHKIFVVGNDE